MKKSIWAAILSALVVLGIIFGGGYYCWNLLQPVNSSSTEKIDVLVAKGQTLSQLSGQLQAQGLIKNADALRAYAKITRTGDQIKTGLHQLSPSQSVPAIISALETEPEQVNITILPGWRREEIAEYLAQMPLSDFDSQRFLDLTATLEGQLMPETYKIAPLSTADTIVHILHRQFVSDVLENSELKTALEQDGRSLNEILTIASLLQREANQPEQMAVIAGILNNRLTDNYPLQLCASAQYAKGKDPKTGKWWEPPTLADTEYDSPYNTYVYKGLPPGPICSLSLEAIQAALHPTETDYYYYLHDKQGQIHYAKTLEEHQVNKAYL